MTNDTASQNIVKDGLQNLIDTARQTTTKGLPPVHLWNPPFCGDLDMRIGRDGTWYYMGTPIGRKPLVRLFASILRKDGDRYFLVTPVEKVGITVDDAPFVAVDFTVAGQGQDQEISFVTNVDDMVTAGRDHPIRLAHDPETGAPAPYVLVRTNLEALIDRKSFYRLVDIAEHHRIDGTSWFGVWSCGTFFRFMRSDDINA